MEDAQVLDMYIVGQAQGKSGRETIDDDGLSSGFRYTSDPIWPAPPVTTHA
jgi:hypothetical protein